MSPEFRYLPWDQGRRGEVNGEALAVMASWVVTETGLTRYSLICFFHGRAESLQVSTSSAKYCSRLNPEVKRTAAAA